MRAAIIKITVDLIETLLDMIRLKLFNTALQALQYRKKCFAGSNTMLSSCPHVFNLNTSVWISTRFQTFLTQIFVQFGISFIISQTVFPPRAQLYTWQISHTCTHKHLQVHLHSLESLSPPSGCEILGAPRSAAFSSERRLCERESLCDTRA